MDIVGAVCMMIMNYDIMNYILLRLPGSVLPQARATECVETGQHL